ncbi:FAD:protein FMN transferase [Pseudobutyrivibrio sp.]|uniref:FAD:protein FMN transferase n=1 Tax=Pseudobutyrivibrio sp. TaxID=2014367 RepID=UPI0025EFB5E8|nr:FAD:protein FMN transferase [Pseudobutyrivibrio sp.]MBR5649915.1 FAD:protein FMN transferase [Pseudobutyrivibrio sp.]
MNKGKLISIGAICILIVFIVYKAISGSVSDVVQDKYSIVFIDLFDTRTEITGYDVDEESFAENAAYIKDRLTYYNQLYDIYNSYEGFNNIRDINENAGVQPVVVNEDIIELIKFGKDIYYETDGQVNIAMGSLLSIWHEYRQAGIDSPKTAALPSTEELQEAATHTDIEDVVIDEVAGTVFLADAQMSLDVGGIAKGYAVERVVQEGREHGIDHLLLNVGGNISCIGTKGNKGDFNIGIQNPDLESEELYIETVPISNGVCVVSSGDYQRFYEVDGTRYCHIIDPDTLYPATEFKQVSIVTDDSGKADAFSTAVFNMTLNEGQEYISNHPGVEAMWVMQDGSIVYSKGFNDKRI